ncbi:MAG: GNAT family N-acetyltransferase [Candidatus Omnitrophica bacterium]|nr:GNAT family N-acetyltransferase [Candidatus Omnitrophota bacterium]
MTLTKNKPRTIKATKALEGATVYLRKIVLFDVNANYHRWMNDSQVIQYLEVRHSRRNLKDLREYVSGVIESKDEIFFAICLNDNGRHIGNIKLGPINRAHGFAYIGFLIGEREFWGQGIATEAVGAVTRYAFEVLGLHKVLAGCYANNDGSLRVFQKCGFKREGVQESQWLCEGKYVNGILLAKINPLHKK